MAYSQMVGRRGEKLIRCHIFRVIFIYAHFRPTALQVIVYIECGVVRNFGQENRQRDSTSHFMRAIKIKSRQTR